MADHTPNSPDSSRADSEVSSDDVNGNSPPTADSKMVALPSSRPYDSLTAFEVTRRRRTRVILLAGIPDSGKTTLISSIYECFQNGRLDEHHAFRQSFTLHGFEERCHDARISSGRSKPDTKRTHISEGTRFLHLSIGASPGSKGIVEILLSDFPGESIRQIKNSSEDAVRFDEFLRADRTVMVIDGAALADPARRHIALNDARHLLRSLIDTNMLNLASAVDLVVTKYDCVVTSPDSGRIDDLLSQLEVEIRKQFNMSHERCRLWRTAARPDAKSKLGFAWGVKELLCDWTTESVQNVIAEGKEVVVADERMYQRFVPVSTEIDQ